MNPPVLPLRPYPRALSSIELPLTIQFRFEAHVVHVVHAAFFQGQYVFSSGSYVYDKLSNSWKYTSSWTSALLRQAVLFRLSLNMCTLWIPAAKPVSPQRTPPVGLIQFPRLRRSLEWMKQQQQIWTIHFVNKNRWIAVQITNFDGGRLDLDLLHSS